MIDNANATSATFSSNSMRSISVSQRYRGMIEESFYKKLRNGLFVLFDYIAQTAPPLFVMHAIISVWRIIQFIGASMVANNKYLWGQDTIMDKVTDIISILFHILPTSVREKGAPIAMIVFIAVFMISYVCVVGSAYYFMKKQKLPRWVTISISIYFATVGYIFPPVACNLCGEMIGRMIAQPDKYVTTSYICYIIFAFLTLLIYIWIFNNIYAVTIIFRPDSLMTVVPSVQTFNASSSLFITLLLGIASTLKELPCLIITLVCALLYFLCNFIYSSKGGLVNQVHLKALYASANAGGILLIVVAVFMILKKTATEVILVIYIGVWIACYIAFSFIVNIKTNKVVDFLDTLEEDETNYERIRTSRYLSDIVVTGMRVAHPACLSWKLFKFGVEKWPNSIDIWLLYSKFIAIYPEETQQLSFISMGIVQNHLKGSLAKHTITQINAIMKQRESNLAPDLKIKLDKIAKQVQQTKHKVRYIWDLILQGNIKELEAVISHACTAIENCEAEFYHVLRQFPNNRFVARSYARFLRDVIADHATHKQWVQNVSALQRGISVEPDQAHELGIMAFPLLPKMVESNFSVQTQTQGVMTEDTLTQEIDNDEEQAAIDAELRASVRDSINTLVIPSFKEARILRMTTWIICFFIPCIALAVYIPYFIEMIVEPLDFIYTISNIRTLVFQSTAFAHHYIVEHIVAQDIVSGLLFYPLSPPSALASQIEDPPKSFGSTFDSREQVKHVLEILSTQITALAPVMGFKTGNAQMGEIRTKLFDPSINFTYYSDPKFDASWTDSDQNYDHVNITQEFATISLQSACVDYVTYLHDIIDQPNITQHALMNRGINIAINNIRLTTDSLSAILETFRNYVISNDKEIRLYLIIALAVVCVIIPIVYIISGVVIMRHVTFDKLVIYKCLTSLPKNIVSRVADSFKVLKKDEDDETKSKSRDEDLNKQEENMLKIFAASSDSGSGNSTDLIIVIIITILLIGCFAGYAVSILNFFMESSSQLMKSAPHIDFLTSTYSYDLAALLLLNMLPGTAYLRVMYRIYNFPKETILENIYPWQARAAKVYSAIRYGDDELNAVPFQSLGINIDSGLTAGECDGAAVPVVRHDVYSCWSSDLLFSFVQMQVKSMVEAFTVKNIMFAGNSFYIDHLWHIHQYHLYDTYFGPRFDGVISMVLESMNKKVSMMTGIDIGIMIFALILEIIFLKALTASETRQKFALRLLLHCPGNVVVSNNNITTILAGNFKAQHIDATTRGSEFYDKLVKDMPDSIIIMDLEGKVMSANKSTSRIFNATEEELVNETLNTIGMKFKEGNPFEKFFDDQGALTNEQNFEKEFSIDKEDGTQHYLEVVFSVLPENLLLVVRDVTQTFMYNKLISDERSKSDKLLSAILPAKLVPRVQAGEKNISFAVQTATILFMDICSFTPWCGSLPASKVMATLNRLFKEYDSLVAMHPTITKIKCIGDCYMCAGGIFADVNQPASHAKDVVDFGLDSIEALIRVNQEIDQDLKMRVGINTGGPIVAGVLGTEKPTFEILGPTINMAQQMEHHGVPMKVHVSRAVYELIYGGNFIVKERGEIEIKNGTVVTYLIDRKQTQN